MKTKCTTLNVDDTEQITKKLEKNQGSHLEQPLYNE